MRPRPEAIIFDLYETLITEFDPDWIPRPSTAQRLGVDEAAFSEVWQQSYEHRMTGVIPDFPNALRTICHRLGHEPNKSVVQQLHQERLSTEARAFTLIEDSILDMVQRLSASAVKLGVLSNAAREEVAAWDECTLAPFFDDVVFSYQVGLIKPDTRIYQLACQRLGVSPEATLFVGDGESDELTGAANAGLTPYWASWFLVRWPYWKRSATLRERAARFVQLQSPGDLVHFATREQAP